MNAAEQCVVEIRPDGKPRNRYLNSRRKGLEMKKFGFASIIATGFAAALVGLAAPAQADITHHQWINDIQQHASTGQVTSTFGNGR
jgi:hypothetical protein